jgi:UDPglucose--hexose-1-phosphate uridylyltransferase
MVVTGLSVIPEDLHLEADGFSRFTDNCLLCTTAAMETVSGQRVVYRDDRIVVVCPYWSQSPYELLLIPRHSSHLHTAAADDLAATGRAIRRALRALRSRLGGPRCRVTFHSAPLGHHNTFHWHVHLVPEVMTSATYAGIQVNPIAPETAAGEIRDEYRAAA